jgi:heat shock protein HslJ
MKDKRPSRPSAPALRLLVAALGCALLAGCSDGGGSPPGILATWQLQAFTLDDGTTLRTDDPARYTVEFRADGRAHVRADCNVCNGSYFVDGSSLSFEPLGCTRAACPPESLDLRFTSALGTSEHYEIEGGSLVIVYEEGRMFFTPAPRL